LKSRTCHSREPLACIVKSNLKTLPDELKYRFFKTIFGDISVSEFEQWLYQTDDVERHLMADDYLDLISYNFKQPGAKYGLVQILEKHINLGEYQTWKLENLLNSVERKEGNYPSAITEFYDLYCRGYGFLDDLGFGYGLALDCPYTSNGHGSFEDLTKQQQLELADSFFPQIITEIERVRNWLHSGKIVLTGEKDELGHYEYVDNRTEEEIRPTTFTKESNSTTVKKWWQVWK